MPPGLSLDQWPVLGSVLGVVMITAVAVIERRRVPMLVAGWGAYVMLVLPVSGLMPTIVLQGVATRFAYVATLPLLLVAGGTGVWVWRRSAAAARLALIGLLAGQLCVFGVRARRLIPVWRNTETELRAELAEFPDSEEINRDLAGMLLDQARVSEALDYAQRDVRIAPQMGQTHLTLGLVLGRLGRLPEAIAQYQQALRITPDSAEAHLNLGNALLTQGDVRGATAHYEEALRLKPDSAEAHDNLGTALAQAGRLPEAMQHWEQALKLKPDDVEAHMNLGYALREQSRIPEAIAHYQQALKLRPELTAAKDALARLQNRQ
jgi:Flp pilus assembly protein TadD